VLGEIRTAVEVARHRDPAKARALDAWLVGLERRFGDRVLLIGTGSPYGLPKSPACPGLPAVATREALTRITDWLRMWNIRRSASGVA